MTHVSLCRVAVVTLALVLGACGEGPVEQSDPTEQVENQEEDTQEGEETPDNSGKLLPTSSDEPSEQQPPMDEQPPMEACSEGTCDEGKVCITINTSQQVCVPDCRLEVQCPNNGTCNQETGGCEFDQQQQTLPSCDPECAEGTVCAPNGSCVEDCRSEGVQCPGDMTCNDQVGLCMPPDDGEGQGNPPQQTCTDSSECGTDQVCAPMGCVPDCRVGQCPQQIPTCNQESGLCEQ